MYLSGLTTRIELLTPYPSAGHFTVAAAAYASSAELMAADES